MTTGIPSGLGVTVGWAEEVTVGTYVTVTRWLPHLKAEFKWKKKTVTGPVLRGNRFLLASRRAMISHTVDGTIEFTAVDKQLGVFFKHALGCKTPTSTEITTTGVYTQTFVTGNPEGMSLSAQKGVPELPGGTIFPLSYNGLKVVTWDLSVATDQIGKFAMTLDGWDEATATTYTAASYLTGTSAPHVLTFAEGKLLLGGTVTTTSGITSVATGATPVGLVSSVSIKGDNKYDVARYPLGSKTKKEQISNAFANYTGTVEIEFASKADFYTAFKTDTDLALQFSLTGPKIGTTGTNKSKITVILPAIYFEGTTPNEPGEGIIKVKVPFTAYDDGKGDPVCQIQYVTTTATP